MPEFTIWVARNAHLYDMAGALKIARYSTLTAGLCLLAACVKEPPPRPVTDFLEDPILLEATMVRCAQNRSKTKYESECVSAREAANRLAAVDEAARRKELEAQSARKRKALRRTQEARAEARRRAAEVERRRREAEYLGVFEDMMQPTDGSLAGSLDNTPNTDVMNNAPGARTEPADPRDEPRQAEIPPGGAAAGDLESIREELRRRQDEDGQ